MLIHREIKSQTNRQSWLIFMKPYGALTKSQEETIGYIKRNWDGIENGVKL
ncbi:MAG: hypothetical protein GX036_00955 [Firmicutes bacterium]|jgi:hypothetical protein|nr:hypothetical protein [Bacillota bacterium]